MRVKRRHIPARQQLEMAISRAKADRSVGGRACSARSRRGCGNEREDRADWQASAISASGSVILGVDDLGKRGHRQSGLVEHSATPGQIASSTPSPCNWVSRGSAGDASPLPADRSRTSGDDPGAGRAGEVGIAVGFQSWSRQSMSSGGSSPRERGDQSSHLDRAAVVARRSGCEHSRRLPSAHHPPLDAPSSIRRILDYPRR